jgi:O-antigen/teichoic acid export membrane protein
MKKRSAPQDSSTPLDPPTQFAGLRGHAVQMIAMIGQEGFELLAGVLVMVMVERAYGPSGLGIFAYLMACMFAVRYLSVFGVVRYVEVETARRGGEPDRQQLFAEGTAAVFCLAVAAAMLLLATAWFDTSHTRIEERFAAYVILALLLPVANINSLKLGVLNGLGHHGQVAWLRMMRHGAILALIYFFTRAHLAPSLLLIAYLLADIHLSWQIRRYCRLPGLRQLGGTLAGIGSTLRQASAYMFTDNGLDLLLNIDFFVLGLFVGADKLGIYAEAAVLVRCCLVLASALKPILRRRYTVAAGEQPGLLSTVIGQHTALFFCLQALFALVTLLYYPLVLDFFFDFRRETVQSLEIFMVFVPGLIFYTTFMTVEPVYEAMQRAEDLKRLTLTVVGVNFGLTLYLVPAAGIFGAAAATMLTMLVHFLLFGRSLPLRWVPGKTIFLSAGVALYLVYSLLSNLAWHPAVYFWLGPLLLLTAFYGCGLFGIDLTTKEEAAAQPVKLAPVDQG